jgi:hypothetical protein
MDAGLAALIGAGIGAITSLLGSFFGPWLRDVATAKAKRKEDARLALRTELIATIEAFGNVLRARHEHTELNPRGIAAGVAVTRVALLLESDEKNVEQLLSLTQNVLRDPDLKVAEAGMMQMQLLVHRWFRGDIAASRLIVAFAHNMNVVLGLPTANGSTIPE